MRIKWLFAILAIYSAFYLSAHPAMAGHASDGHQPKEVFNYDQGAPEEWSIGDVQFYDPQSKPPLESLTDTERYMLAGTVDSSLPSGSALGPWFQQVYMAALKLYQRHGSIPEVLDPDQLRELPEFAQIPQGLLDVYRNPLTGEWPRLRSMDPSPGDLFIHVLSDSEMQFIAQRSPYRQKLWFGGKALNGDVNWEQNKSIKLIERPFYIRLYGWNGVLWAGLATGYTDN